MHLKTKYTSYRRELIFIHSYNCIKVVSIQINNKMLIISIRYIKLIFIQLIIIYSSVECLSIGRVNNTRFTSLNHLNTNSIWLSNFTRWSECMCAILSSSNYSSTAVALNMYRNGSCQLFIQLPITYTLEVNSNSTLILFKQLPSKTLAPCCSNISWLINKLNNSQLSSGNVSKPSFVVIDDNDLLVTLSYKDALVRFNRSTLKVIQSALLVPNATSLTYYNGYYYIRKLNLLSFLLF